MIALNALSQTAAMGIGLLVQTIYIVAVARTLSIPEFGQFNLVFAITQILFLGGDLGIHNTALRRIAEDRRHSQSTFQRFLFLKILLALFGFTVAVAIAFFLGEQDPGLGLCMFWFGVGLFSQSLGMAFNIAYQAHNRLYLASFNVLTGVTVHAALGGIVLLSGGNLVGLGGAYAAAQGVALAINVLLFPKTIHPIYRLQMSGTCEFALHSIPVGIGSLLESLTARLGIVLLMFFAGETATGIFSAAGRITGAMRNVPLGIFSAVLPVMAATSDPAEVRRVFARYAKVSLGLAALTVVPLWMGSDFLIAFLYKPEFAESSAVLRILVASLPLLFVSGGLAHLLLSRKRLVGRHPWIAAAGTLSTVLFYYLLVPRWGVLGAAWAQLATEGVVLCAYIVGVGSYLRGRTDGGDSR